MVLVLVFSFLIPLANAEDPIKPTFTTTATPFGNSIIVKISGADIDHAAIISDDQSKWIGNMIGYGSNWTYTITDLQPETVYNFFVKASSVNNGSNNSPLENVTWQNVTVTTPKIKTITSLPNSGMMCLTFDDGYGTSYIKTILDCLRENNVQCTFFIIGSQLKANPDLWQQAITDGNEICYHSMLHEDLTSYSNQKILDDITKWNATAKKVLGDDYIIPPLARLPGGSGNNSKRILELFNSIGYNVIGWNSDTYYDVIRKDSKASPQKIADYVIKMASVGTISLQHFNKYDAPSVSLYIATLKEKYSLGKISDAITLSFNTLPS